MYFIIFYIFSFLNRTNFKTSIFIKVNRFILLLFNIKKLKYIYFFQYLLFKKTFYHL